MTGLGKCWICKLVGLLLVVGALNWGLVGLAQVDVVARVLGDMTGAARAVYLLIGLAGVVGLIACFKGCPCTKGPCAPKPEPPAA